jgi:hypothetical protein
MVRRKDPGRFLNSALLFQFCQKIMSDHSKKKVYDQDVGSILGFSPSDCSHWKKGGKNVSSIDYLLTLSEFLKVDELIISDIIFGHSSLEEALYDHYSTMDIKSLFFKLYDKNFLKAKERVLSLTNRLQQQFNYSSAPIYLPEVLGLFTFVSYKPVDHINKLSRILKINANNYCIQYKKVDINPQTRASVIRDLARIIFRSKRSEFAELSEFDSNVLECEEIMFTVNMLIPSNLFKLEYEKISGKKNIVSELSSVFWVPRNLILLKLKDYIHKFSFQQETAQEKEVFTPSHP